MCIPKRKEHVAPQPNIKCMRHPCLETMETVDTVLTVWQISASSSTTPFTLSEQRLCTHLDKHTLPPFPHLQQCLTHTCAFSAHRLTQCMQISLNISYDLKICGEGPVIALSFSFFICSLYFDSA